MPIFTPQSMRLILHWNQTIKGRIKIKRIITDHAEEKQFINFGNQLSDLASSLIIETKKNGQSLPCFRLKENITYSALPLEKELDPFLETLSRINDRHTKLSAQIKQALDKIDIPVMLKLYIALACPHCPHVVRALIPLALYCRNIHLNIIDGSLFPETAQKDNVLSAPCLILDDAFKWTGSIDVQEIIEMIIGRDPSQLSSATLKTILERGDAAWITRQMIEKQKIFNAFINLLVHDTWSVRLGAMVVVEDLVETDPDLAARLSPALIDLFDKKDISVQGDILYALGEAGGKGTKKWITETIPKLDHPDLIDAAADALDSLTMDGPDTNAAGAVKGL